MARKLVLRKHQVVSSGDMSADVTSDTTNIEHLDNIAYQLVWTGTPTGTFAVEGTVDGSTWAALDLSDPILASGSADDALIVLSDLSFVSIRVKYTRTSGTGTLNVFISGKTSGA